MSVVDIIEGHVNEALNKNEDLFHKRLKICEQCPLYKVSSFGPICNPMLFMDNDGNVSLTPKRGYKKGCGCRLNAKARLERAQCAHGRWKTIL